MKNNRINVHVKENRFVEENPEFQKDYEEIKRKRENKIAEDAAKAIDNEVAEDAVSYTEVVDETTEDKNEKKGCLVWAIVLVIIALLLGHIIWCVTHHDEQLAEQSATVSCHLCTKPLAECKCAELIKCSVCGFEEEKCTCIQKIKDLTSVVYCEKCNEPRLTSCTCKEAEEVKAEGTEHVCNECDIHCPKAECTGSCPVHCPEAEAEKPAEQKPVTQQQKPSQQKPAQQESKPDKKPIKVPGADYGDGDDDDCDNGNSKPDPKPQPSKPEPSKPAKCSHEHTKDVVHEKETSSNGEWTQKVEVVCCDCDQVLDSWHRAGVIIDMMIPDNNNDVIIDDNGEAASPVS